jgi:hypothetical protein
MVLNLGVHSGQQDVEVDELRQLWRSVDRNGWDSVAPATRSSDGPVPLEGEAVPKASDEVNSAGGG